MPPVFVKKVVGSMGGINSFDLTFGSDVGAGSYMVAGYSVWHSGGPSPANPAPTGGGTWSTTTASTTGGQDWNAFVNFCSSATGGATTVTVDYGTGFYIAGAVAEFTGMDATPLDQQQVNYHSSGSDLTPDVGPTGTLTQADELVVAVLSVSTSAPAINACTINGSGAGVVNLHAETNGSSFMPGSIDYLIVSATSAVTAAWGNVGTGNGYWAAKLATFKASSAPAGKAILPPRHPMAHMLVR